MKRILSMIICLATIVVSFAGCSTLKGDDKGAIINVFLAEEVYNFDPAMNYHSNEMVKFFSLIYEGLTRLDAKGNWQKALMKSYEKSFDSEIGEYKVTITLNSTQWSDGRSVQAQDVVYAWKRILDPSFYGAASSMLYDIKNARAVKRGDVSIDDLGVLAVDTYVLDIYFEYEVDLDAFFRTCASPALVPLREDKVENAEDWATKTSSMVTNGPFTLKEINWEAGEQTLRLERNSNYYLDNEKDEALDKYVIPWRIVTHYSIGNLDAQLAAFDNEEIFYLGEIPLSARADRMDDATITDEMSTHTYVFNTEKTIFKDARVRRALSMAIDRNAIVEILTYAKPATGLVPYGIKDGTAKDDFRTVADNSAALLNTSADVDGAKALLKEAGVTSGSFTITVKGNSEADLAVAEYVKGVWNSLGFNVTVKTLDVYVQNLGENTKKNIDMFGNALNEGSFDVIAIDTQMLNTEAFSALSVFATKFSGGGVDMNDSSYPYIGHYSKYENAAYSELIEKAYAEHDLDARTAILHEAEALLMQDMPIIPLVFNQDAYLINKKVIPGSKDTFWGTRDFTRLKMKNYMAYKEEILAAEEAANAANQ
ncbi:MAG: peptide ABC transporter substrate-binding protein [Clostridia bacterium]|nr:peptide ABC transporter substrate-binding protein [Clostridia bacterium]